MSKLMTGLLLTVGIASMAVPPVVGLAGTAEPGPEDAVLVVTWPWAEDPATVVERAGGQDIGPVSAPMAVLASGATVAAYRRLMHAGLAEDRAALRDALLAIGFVSPVTLERHSGAFDAMIDVLMRHLGRPGLFEFADRSFVAEVRRQVEIIAADRAAWHIPPADTLFVQRKVSGTAMLAVRMEARLPLRDMVAAKLA